jgi:GMP synthase-like glutamine amidotransferase
MPSGLHVSATTPDGLVMAVEHRWRPVVGVQFHPEAILTEHGYRLLANFLELAGLPLPAQLPDRDNELCLAPAVVHALPAAPVTF